MENMELEVQTGQELSVDEEIALVQRQSDFVRRVKTVALSATTPEDWTDQGGKPYLTISGSANIKNTFGVSITDSSWVRNDREDENGKYYEIAFTATFTFKMASTTMTGTCSSRDKFIGSMNVSEVKEGNIVKKAETNCLGRGIKFLIGIGNPTWEDLKELGIERAKVAKVEYRDKQAVSDEMKEKQGKLRKMLLEKLKIMLMTQKIYLR